MSKAYEMAGYKFNGSNASKLTKKTQISTRIAELLEEQGIIPDHVKSEVAKLAFSEPSDDIDIEALIQRGDLVFKEGAKLHNVQSIKISDKFGVEIRFHDKRASLDLLARILNILTNKTELSGSVHTNTSSVNIYIPDNARDRESDNGN